MGGPQRLAAFVKTRFFCHYLAEQIDGVIKVIPLQGLVALGKNDAQVARQAIVRGSLADKLGKWGPATITTSAVAPNPVNPNDATSVIRQTASASLADWNRSQVTVKVEWPDGGNDPRLEHRVRVTVSGPYHPIMTFIFGNPAYTLAAGSTMQIAH